ncbi:MAG: uroporphyrinogen-III C-methyltransferase [Candidatus Anammoxibacter sp.]
MDNGIVYLVGAGPGDPGLISVKGLKCIQKGDIIIYDYLVNISLINEAKKEAEVIYVGKQGGAHTMEQEDINRLIVKKANEGKVIVRLKGGDPYVFGRGGEEALFLVENNIPFEVVPGITAAIASPAYAGIPVTFRKYTSTFGLITGHEDPTKPDSDIPWDKISTGIGTLAFYMGVKNLPFIVKQLIDHGRAKETPVAVIRWGTRSKQETVVGTLANIVEVAKSIKAPAITIVGEVVNLREKLNWFEKKELFGKTIVVTRSRDQASEFSEKLEELGAEVIEFPTINIVEPDDFKPLDAEIAKLEDTDWLIFTSVNGVDAFFDRILALNKDIRDLKGIKICAIGPATEQRIKDLHLRVDCKPPKYVAESIVDEFKKIGEIEGKKFLIPRADIARSYLPDALQSLGGKVSDIVAYKTIIAEPRDFRIVDKLKDGEINVVTFTSSSTVRNFVKIIGDENISAIDNKVTFASIGPITTKTAKELGINISIETEEYTIPGLVDALLKEL